jgi:peptidoglycan hydrolase-like protein with peptidoglycan-binding domain
MQALTQRVVSSEASAVRADQARMTRDVSRGNWIIPGDRGDEVVALQRALRGAGVYKGAINGTFDQATLHAVKSFQDARGLTVDGLVGPKTLKALKGNQLMVKDGFQNAAHAGQSGKDVLAAERKLHALGYNTGKVDGVFDASTRNAVNAFRAKDRTLPDGKGTIDHDMYTRLMQAHVQGGARPAPTTPAPNTPASKIASWDKTPPKADYHHVNFRGVTVNKRTEEMLKRAEYIMQHKYGHTNFHMELSQGSYHQGVGASAGTHDGGGTVDVRTRGHSRAEVDDMVKAMRQAGFAAWSRGRGHDNFAPHIHAVALGDRDTSASARSQIPDYAAGRNGLANNARDPDANLGRPVPAWARRYL